MPAVILSDLHQMSTEDIVSAMSSIVATRYWANLAEGEINEDCEKLRLLVDELERRLVLEKYIV